MEEQNITYTGITQATSDLDCRDGELSLSHNIISQNGAMRPILLPEAQFTMGEGEQLVYVHSTAGYKNYLYTSSGQLKAFRLESGQRTDYDFSYNIGEDTEINQIQSIGNTIIVLASDSIHYILFKDDDYKYLGNKFPELGMNFGLEGTENEAEIAVDFSTNEIDFNQYGHDAIIVLPDESSEQIYSQVIGTINKMMSDEKDYGRFVHPFLVRYAYNTISGYTMQSPPVLMLPNTRRFPAMQIYDLTEESGGGVLKSFKVTVKFYSATMHYWASHEVIEALGEWKDIILGVDIFVSDPIQELVDTPYGWSLSYGSLPGQINLRYDFGGGYMTLSPEGVYAYTGNPVTTSIPALFPPRLGDEAFAERVKGTSVFWKVKSIALDEVEEEGYLDIDGSVLQNLGTQETLPDDYCSHDVLSAGSAFVYNSRLNLSNVGRKPFVPPVKQLVTYIDAPEQTDETTLYSYKATVFIKSGLSTVKAESESSMMSELAWWVYYPNPNAFRMVIEREKDGVKQWADLTLTEHTGLNGAYYYTQGYIAFADTQPILPSGTDDTIQEPNKIYTSEVGNPFYFPLGGINTVGTGEIVGISITTRALSQGQFGQFPLLVFATDGIWAMEVSDEGLYSVRQPISIDVCSNPQSITQTDGEVVFVSSKGVMVVDGSRVDMLSAELDGPSFSPQSVARLNDILSKEGLTEELGQMGTVKDFFQLCKVAYDYPNAKLIFFIPDKKIAWVYSLNSRTWATMTAGIMQAVTDYPGCYVQMADGTVINISTKQDFDDTRQVKTLLLTRPLKLGDVALKTVNTIINRGLLPAKEGAVIVFASHDGERYVPIGSAVGHRLSRLQGSPYRYFRLCVVREMDAGQSLSATSVYLTRKWRNKPR